MSLMKIICPTPAQEATPTLVARTTGPAAAGNRTALVVVVKALTPFVPAVPAVPFVPGVPGTVTISGVGHGQAQLVAALMRFLYAATVASST